MAIVKTRVRAPIISIVVITMSCGQCGGNCVSQMGNATYITREDVIAKCEHCGQTYNVPQKPFVKKYVA